LSAKKNEFENGAEKSEFENGAEKSELGGDPEKSNYAATGNINNAKGNINNANAVTSSNAVTNPSSSMRSTVLQIRRRMREREFYSEVDVWQCVRCLEQFSVSGLWKRSAGIRNAIATGASEKNVNSGVNFLPVWARTVEMPVWARTVEEGDNQKRSKPGFQPPSRNKSQTVIDDNGKNDSTNNGKNGSTNNGKPNASKSTSTDTTMPAKVDLTPPLPRSIPSLPRSIPSVSRVGMPALERPESLNIAVLESK
jgi:hypothetical protein